MSTPYATFVEINPEFDELYAEMNMKEKLTFLDIVNKMNNDAPPEGYYDEDQGAFVFNSDDGESVATLFKNEDNNFDLEVTTEKDWFSETLTEDVDDKELADAAAEGEGSTAFFRIADDGSAVVYKGSAEEWKVEAEADKTSSDEESEESEDDEEDDTSETEVEVEFDEAEHVLFKLESPKISLDEQGDVVAEQSAFSIEAGVRVGEDGIEWGTELKINAGPLSIGVKIQGHSDGASIPDGPNIPDVQDLNTPDLADPNINPNVNPYGNEFNPNATISDFNPFEFSQLKLEGLNNQMADIEFGLQNPPTDLSPEDLDALHEQLHEQHQQCLDLQSQLVIDVQTYQPQYAPPGYNFESDFQNVDVPGGQPEPAGHNFDNDFENVDVPDSVNPYGDNPLDNVEEMLEEVEELTGAVDDINVKIQEVITSFEAI